MGNKRTRQVTLHFNPDTDYILDAFKAEAKKEMRTVEQQLLFELKKVVPEVMPLTIMPEPPPSIMVDDAEPFDATTAVGTTAVGKEVL